MITAQGRTIHEIDASGQILGRLATHVATLLRGKHKSDFVLNKNIGDIVIISNPEQIMVTGRKLTQKMYYRHSGYPGGITQLSLGERMKTSPEGVIIDAVKNMLPKNRLRPLWLKQLKFKKNG